jgi:hypothetical protein
MTQRKKRRRRQRGSAAGRRGGGLLGGMRSGFQGLARSVAGQPSAAASRGSGWFGWVITLLLLVAAIALLLQR